MARNNPAPAGEFDLESAENETISRVNKTLSKIEKAVSIWDSSKEKPPTLRPRVEHLRRFHGELSNWERKMLLSISKRQSRSKRIALLREFTEICHTYA